MADIHLLDAHRGAAHVARLTTDAANFFNNKTEEYTSNLN